MNRRRQVPVLGLAVAAGVLAGLILGLRHHPTVTLTAVTPTAPAPASAYGTLVPVLTTASSLLPSSTTPTPANTTTVTAAIPVATGPTTIVTSTGPLRPCDAILAIGAATPPETTSCRTTTGGIKIAAVTACTDGTRLQVWQPAPPSDTGWYLGRTGDRLTETNVDGAVEALSHCLGG